ncbi:CoB--CoM heterodisulfide reductase iron-sulfur subunit B family protein [Desulfobacterium sp. N47]
MMKYALFLGCTIQRRVRQYELSSRAVLKKLGVKSVTLKQFNCCGYPLRNSDFKMFVLLGARNLAIAEKRGLHLMTLCKCCYGSLKKVNDLLKNDPSLLNETNAILAKEQLAYTGNAEVTHLLSVLHKDVGLEAIKEKVKVKFKDLNIATHYGCHALRPSEITQFDNAADPVLFDQLVEVTGARSIEWPLKLECCGAPLTGVNDELSMDLMGKKISSATQAGAHFLCVGCPWCYVQFDSVQVKMSLKRGINNQLPGILYPQLLGLAMGIGGNMLGLDKNQIELTSIKNFLAIDSQEGQKQ